MRRVLAFWRIHIGCFSRLFTHLVFCWFWQITLNQFKRIFMRTIITIRPMFASNIIHHCKVHVRNHLWDLVSLDARKSNEQILMLHTQSWVRESYFKLLLLNINVIRLRQKITRSSLDKIPIIAPKSSVRHENKITNS